jgi:hypothetical protein
MRTHPTLNYEQVELVSPSVGGERQVENKVKRCKFLGYIVFFGIVSLGHILKAQQAAGDY